MRFRFVSNVDGTDFAEAVRDLDPAEKSREEPALAHDSSTNNLIRRYRKLKEAS